MRRYVGAIALLVTVLAAGSYAGSKWLWPRICELSTLVHVSRAAVRALNGDMEEAAALIATAASLSPRHDHEETEGSGWACLRLERESC